MERIKSRRHPLVQEAAALLKSREQRYERGLFLCEGARLCEDAARSDLTIYTCFVTDGAMEKYESYLKPVLTVCRKDPGNLGTTLRTAEALGIRSVFLLGEGCDLFSPKALRASMGAVFRLSLVLERDPKRLKTLLEGYTLHAAVPDSGATPVTEIDFSTGLHAILIGNEGNGLTEETISLCHDRITIPMRGRAESLNASAAANILLWELCRKGGAGVDER